MRTERISQQNFTGYTNAICSSTKANYFSLNTLAMKLNDIGTPDLTNFRRLKAEHGLPKDRIDNDIIKITSQQAGPNGNIFLSIDEFTVPDGNELKILKRKVNSPLSEMLYQGFENSALTVYRFIENLTKNVAKAKNIAKDDGYEDVIFDTAKYFTERMNNPTFAVNYVTSMGRQTRIKPQEVAKNLYDICSDTIKEINA